VPGIPSPRVRQKGATGRSGFAFSATDFTSLYTFRRLCGMGRMLFLCQSTRAPAATELLGGSAVRVCGETGFELESLVRDFSKVMVVDFQPRSKLH
jgi:hypothetical protein